MSNHKQKTGEGIDKPRPPEWYAEVRREAREAMARIRARDEAARARGAAKLKAEQQRNHGHG